MIYLPTQARGGGNAAASSEPQGLLLLQAGEAQLSPGSPMDIDSSPLTGPAARPHHTVRSAPLLLLSFAI